MQMDPTLSAFLQTTDLTERERLLNELILGQAAPLVRQVLWYRLKFYIDQRGANPATPEAEDLYQDVIAKLIRVLNQLHSQGKEGGIKDFRQYTIRVTINVCNDYLRSKYPFRTRLKDKVRDTLERHPDFDLWKSETGETIGGLAIWPQAMFDTPASERIKLLEEQPEIIKQERFPQMDSRKIPLPKLLGGIFEWAQCPIEIENLVNAAAGLLGIKEERIESLDDEDHFLSHRLAVNSPPHDQIMEEKATLEKLWYEVRQLPANQRDTFIFSFADSKGEDLLCLLFEAGIVTPSRMAEELRMPLDRLVMIWKQMPMRNIDISVLMGVERQQVNKWRYQATKHLEKCFKTPH